MSVLIKGMKIPKTCDECWALDDYEYPRCRITEEQRGYNFPIREKRMDKCPLVFVPPHGKLIEKNDVFKLIQAFPEIDKLLPVEFMKALYNLTTIIPAESPKEETDESATH